MRLTRLNPAIVAAIGIVLSLAVAGCLIYFLVMPTQQAADQAHQRYTTAYPDSTPQAQALAKKQLAQARINVANTKAQWAVIENTLMPPYDVSQRYTAWKQLSTELALNLGPDLARYFRSTGVVPLTSVSLPAPPANPNAITAAPLVVPIGGSSAGGGGGFSGGGGGFSGGGGSGGGVSVGGDFHHILRHVQLWNNFNRLVLIDNLALHGNSPYMAGDYGASVIIFPQNDDKLDKPIPAAAEGTATPGGMPGGMAGRMGG